MGPVARVKALYSPFMEYSGEGGALSIFDCGQGAYICLSSVEMPSSLAGFEGRHRAGNAEMEGVSDGEWVLSYAGRIGLKSMSSIQKSGPAA